MVSGSETREYLRNTFTPTVCRASCWRIQPTRNTVFLPPEVCLDSGDASEIMKPVDMLLLIFMHNSIFYEHSFFFQFYFVLVLVYSLGVRQSYTLHSAPLNISSSPTGLYIVTVILVTPLPLLYLHPSDF